MRFGSETLAIMGKLNRRAERRLTGVGYALSRLQLPTLMCVMATAPSLMNSWMATVIFPSLCAMEIAV